MELIKADLEQRFNIHETKDHYSLEDYVRQLPEFFEQQVPWDLVYEEISLRRRLGLTLYNEDYLRKYPYHKASLDRIFQDQTLDPQEIYTTTRIVEQQPEFIVRAGQTIGDFELLVELGKGAFASVYLARQTSLQRLVALKVSTKGSKEPETLAQLDHDYIVRVYDQRNEQEKKLFLLYMQYVPGGTIHHIIKHLKEIPKDKWAGAAYLDIVDRELKRTGQEIPTEDPLRDQLKKMNWEELICWIGAGLAGALYYAHRKKVMHRDIKPANVLISARGVPKLADFNISFSANTQGASPAAYFGGSLPYMAPEQMEAFHPHLPKTPGDLDERVDQYALGVMLWELFTGKRPFHDENKFDDWLHSLHEMIDRRKQSEIIPSLKKMSSTFENVLKKSLSPDPEDRYANCSELAREFELIRRTSLSGIA